MCAALIKGHLSEFCNRSFSKCIPTGVLLPHALLSSKLHTRFLLTTHTAARISSSLTATTKARGQKSPIFCSWYGRAANICLCSRFEENGVDNVSLLPIFEPTVSPRNVVIVATKTCDGDGMASNPAGKKEARGQNPPRRTS